METIVTNENTARELGWTREAARACNDELQSLKAVVAELAPALTEWAKVHAEIKSRFGIREKADDKLAATIERLALGDT